MPVNSSPPPINSPIADEKGLLTSIWKAFLNEFFKIIVANLQSQITTLQEQVTALQKEIVRNAISSSSTSPSAILTQADAGSSITITVLAHSRIYDDGTSAAIPERTVTGVPYSTTVGVYYDDPERDGGAVTVAYSADLLTTRHNYVEGRHSLGNITTIASGGTPPSDPEGGSYTPGWNPSGPGYQLP